MADIGRSVFFMDSRSSMGLNVRPPGDTVGLTAETLVGKTAIPSDRDSIWRLHPPDARWNPAGSVRSTVLQNDRDRMRARPISALAWSGARRQVLIALMLLVDGMYCKVIAKVAF